MAMPVTKTPCSQEQCHVNGYMLMIMDIRLTNPTQHITIKIWSLVYVAVKGTVTFYNEDYTRSKEECKQWIEHCYTSAEENMPT